MRCSHLPLRARHWVHAHAAHDRCAAVGRGRRPHVRGGGVELGVLGTPFTDALQRELYKGTPALSSEVPGSNMGQISHDFALECDKPGGFSACNDFLRADYNEGTLVAALVAWLGDRWVADLRQWDNEDQASRIRANRKDSTVSRTTMGLR